MTASEHFKAPRAIGEVEVWCSADGWVVKREGDLQWRRATPRMVQMAKEWLAVTLIHAAETQASQIRMQHRTHCNTWDILP